VENSKGKEKKNKMVGDNHKVPHLVKGINRCLKTPNKCLKIDRLSVNFYLPPISLSELIYSKISNNQLDSQVIYFEQIFLV